MEKTKEEFIIFMHQAIHDRYSPAHTELYQFLVDVFVRADANLDGKIYPDRLDSLVDEAAALPRLYGYAPKTEELYPTEEKKKAARAKLFQEIDVEKNGYVSLEQWITYATKHITGKVTQLPKDVLGGTSADVTKQEFLDFMRKAVQKGTPEYRQMYFFLLKCFQAGDVNKAGAVDPIAFDRMIEAAAAAPRRFGLAPLSSEMFKTDGERLAKRKEYFMTMDTDHNGTISFNEWLTYAHEHIAKKVAGLGK